jgi:hypothetical protein
MRFDVLIAVYMQTVAFWDITLNSGRQVPQIQKNIQLPTVGSLEMKTETAHFPKMLKPTSQTQKYQTESACSVVMALTLEISVVLPQQVMSHCPAATSCKLSLPLLGCTTHCKHKPTFFTDRK